METENKTDSFPDNTQSVKVTELKITFSEVENEIEEIISKKQPFFVRWGISIFFLITVLLIGISWFVQYPDIVIANGSLNSINAPKEVVVQSSGKLIKLFVVEGQMVRMNGILGYMESNANHEQVFFLSSLLDSISKKINHNLLEDIPLTLKVPMDSLGELQPQFQIFSQAFADFINCLSKGFYAQKKVMFYKDMSYLELLHASLLQQRDILLQDVSLFDTTFIAHEQLKNDRVISAMDFRNEKSKLLAKKLTIPQITSSVITNEAQYNEKQKELAELENQIRRQKELFIQSLNTFKSNITDWKRKYILFAPIEGTVSFSSFLQENQLLKQGQSICFINPENTSYYAEALISQNNFGKVRIGQEVLLKFLAYPNQEFGSVKGKVEFISIVPSDSGYLAKISFPKGLITNYGKIIKYRTGLSMQVDIITSKRSILERFLNSFRGRLN